MKLLAQPRTLGRYQILAQLASGGMATVYIGRQHGELGYSRLVALKQPHPHFAAQEEFVEMLLDEGRIAARIHHPNVVDLLDIVLHDGELTLVMEYVHGPPLHQLIKRLPKGRTLPLPLVSAIVSGVCRGLHAAHTARDAHGGALGVVHRDVSPQNVIVGTDGLARVLDFGIAKASGRLTTTRDGGVKGKLAYMAPEQCRREPVGAPTDVYAVGVILWELLAGRRLFAGDTDASILEQLLLGAVSPPSRYVPTLAPALDDLVMKALARSPGDRFATAEELALALETVVAPAAARAVGDCVQELAGDELRQRTAILEALESAHQMSAPEDLRAALRAHSGAGTQRSTDALSAPVSLLPLALEPNETRTTRLDAVARLPLERMRFGLLSVVLVVLLGGGFATWQTLAQASRQRPHAGRTKKEALAAPPASLPQPVVLAPAEPNTSGPAPLPSSVRRARTPAVPAHTCSPPFYFDAEYKKHYKPHCIK